MASVGKDTNALKYQNLFSDAFDHHVLPYLDGPAELKVLADDSSRFLTADSLNSYFLDKLYNLPNIYYGSNSSVTKEDQIEYADFVRRISDDPVTSNQAESEMHGSNRVSFLLGEIGTGKTLLLCKVIRDMILTQRAAQNSEIPLLVPVYFNFDKAMVDGSGPPLDIDPHFYSRLGAAILAALDKFTMFRDKTQSLVAAANIQYPNDEVRLNAVIRTAHKCGLRLLLILDNIDRYHFYFSKYTFFEKGRQKQLESLRGNMGKLSCMFTSGESLGLLGLSVLIAARRYVYDDCMPSENQESSTRFNGSVYQLANIDEMDVVQKRLDLFDEAIAQIESKPRLRPVGEDFKKSLQQIGMLLGLEVTRTKLQESASLPARTVILTVRQLCHHGNRGLVSFLSSLKLDYRENSKVIGRLFWDKPHTLILLYMTDLRKRYSQAWGHFPNLFLVDALVQPDSEFEEAHQPHIHTYWLKYLILAYVNSRPGDSPSITTLRRIFVTYGRYEEHLFRLALGSLSTSTEFGCLKAIPSNHPDSVRVQITERGKALFSRSDRDNSPFCFTFNYLQLVVDDYQMSYPRSIFDQVYVKGIDLGYLFAEELTYHNRNADYLARKMKCAFAFLKVLEESYKLEMGFRQAMFNHFRHESPAVLLDFDRILDRLFEEFRRISSPMPNSDKFFVEIMTYWKKLKVDTRTRDELKQYFSEKVPIER